MTQPLIKHPASPRECVIEVSVFARETSETTFQIDQNDKIPPVKPAAMFS